MNKNDLFLAIGDVDDDILERSEALANRRKTPIFRKWGALAACMALIVSLAVGVLAAEAKEYSTAVAFFEDNSLSTEGLSRSDVKAVYQDIVARRFTYDKTADVIERAVPGLEIDQREPTPEELAALWDENIRMNDQPLVGISYRVDHREKRDKTLGFDILDKSILSCYQDENLLWTAEFPNLLVFVEDILRTSFGTVVWGQNDTWSSEQSTYSSLALVEDGGNILWQRRLDHGFQYEVVEQVIDNGDGTWAVISRGDFEYLCLSQYDKDGNELSFRKTEVGNLGIWNAARLGDGYLVHLRDILDGETARLAKLDHDGNLIDNFIYEGKDCDYYINDMAEFEGRVYLSAYAVPKQTDEGGRHEIADILDYVFNKENLAISGEKLTPLVRDNYTAVLLLCDSEGGAPETFYSVKGSLGAELTVTDAGELEWNVNSVVNTFFSPYTSSFSIGGTCWVFRYTFDKDGNLLCQKDTGEIVPYRR